MIEYRLFDGVTPAFVDAGDFETNIALGTRFYSNEDGWVLGLRFYKAAGNTGVHTGHLWTHAGVHLAAVTFSGETATGWQYAYFAEPVPIAADAIHVISYVCPAGHYSATGSFFDGNYWNDFSGSLVGVDAGFAPNGTYHYLGPGELADEVMPNNSFNKTNYFVDPLFASSLTVTVMVRESGAWVERAVVPKVRTRGQWFPLRPRYWDGVSWVYLQ